MKTTIPILIAAVGILYAVGCSENPPPAEEAAEQDYQEVLERVRTRHAIDENMAAVKQALDRFQIDYGRTPSNLNELVRRNYFEELPPMPDGTDFEYDRGKGNIRVVRVRKKAE